MLAFAQNLENALVRAGRGGRSTATVSSCLSVSIAAVSYRFPREVRALVIGKVEVGSEQTRRRGSVLRRDVRLRRLCEMSTSGEQRRSKRRVERRSAKRAKTGSARGAIQFQRGHHFAHSRDRRLPLFGRSRVETFQTPDLLYRARPCETESPPLGFI